MALASRMLTLRTPEDLVKRIDRHAKQLSSTMGLRVSRSAAILRLLATALEAEERGQGKKRAGSVGARNASR